MNKDSKRFVKPNYDLDDLARKNLHIHTNFSMCAKEEMNLENIIEAAQKADLSEIALTDHFHGRGIDEKFQNHVTDLNKRIEKIKPKLNILVGAELSWIAPGICTEEDKTRDMLAYRLYSYNHFHLGFWKVPEDKSPESFAKYTEELVTTLVLSGNAECIAHPLILKYALKFLGDKDPTEVSKAITDEQIWNMSVLLKQNNVAWEINTKAVLFDKLAANRLWRIGKEAGTCFTLGTDAHALEDIDTKQFLPEIKKRLNA